MERFYSGGLNPLGEREVGVIAGTSRVARDGHIVEMAGMELADYRRNPIVLWQHDPNTPIGVCQAIETVGDLLSARIEFAPAGISQAADHACSLIKAGVVKGVSIGFNPIEAKPIDPSRPRDGAHVTRAELLEISFVSIPADTGAGVVARSIGGTRASFAALRPVPRAAIERAASRLSNALGGGPIVSHAVHVWLLQEQRQLDNEQRYSFEARQREAARMREIARRY